MADEMTNYIEDDFDDNALSGRTSSSKGYYYAYGTGGAGDLLKGVYRPLWTVDNGSPSATNNELQMPSTDGTVSDAQFVFTPSALTTGTWKFDHQFNSNPSSYATYWAIARTKTYNSGDNGLNEGYRLDIHHDTRLRLYEVDSSGASTEIINGSRTDDTGIYTYELARNSYGNWEMFNDGASQGTTTDTNWSDFIYMMLGNRANVRSDFDNIIVQ